MDTHRRLHNIVARKSRRKHLPDTAEILSSIDTLRPLLERSTNDTGQSSALDFIPIRLVTILEVFVRDWISLLVDVGEPFQDRAEKIVRTVKFDYLLSKAMHDQQVSPGDIAADAISLNSLASVIAIFDALLDQSTWDIIAQAKSDDDNLIIASDLEFLKRTVGRVFEVRHVVVHEWPATPPYEPSELSQFIEAVSLFARAIDAGLSALVWWNDPTKVTDLLMIHNDSVSQAQAELDSAMKQLLELRPDGAGVVKAAHESWTAFANAETKVHEVLRDSSVSELISIVERESLIKWRIDEINNLLRALRN